MALNQVGLERLNTFKSTDKIGSKNKIINKLCKFLQRGTELLTINSC